METKCYPWKPSVIHGKQGVVHGKQGVIHGKQAVSMENKRYPWKTSDIHGNQSASINDRNHTHRVFSTRVIRFLAPALLCLFSLFIRLIFLVLSSFSLSFFLHLAFSFHILSHFIKWQALYMPSSHLTVNASKHYQKNKRGGYQGQEKEFL
jgi:hypothetical protein